MLDTNICIYAIRRSRSLILENLILHAANICVSSITYAELRFGSEYSTRRAANLEELSRFIDSVLVFPFDAAAAADFGHIKAHLFSAGTPIGPYDLLIAAHARSHDLTLVTNNRREFDRVPGLKV